MSDPAIGGEIVLDKPQPYPHAVTLAGWGHLWRLQLDGIGERGGVLRPIYVIVGIVPIEGRAECTGK